MPIPIIDLFAGPGGLGEGFTKLRRGGRAVFKIGVSIEKDPTAHKTLELRAFFRQFPDGEAPPEYYEYIAGDIEREDLFENPKYLKQAPDHARSTAQNRALVTSGHPHCAAAAAGFRLRLGGGVALRLRSSRLSVCAPLSPLANRRPKPVIRNNRSMSELANQWLANLRISNH